MKILLLAPQPFYTQRGTPIAIRNLATVLGEAGHQIDLITYPDGEDIELPNTKIMRVWKIPFIGEAPVGFSLKKLIYDFMMFFAVLWKTLINRYDVIHAVEEAVYIALLCGPLKGSQVVYDMDSSMADQLLEKWPGLTKVKGLLYGFEGLAIRHSDRVIAVCQALLDKTESYRSNTPVDLLTDTVLEFANESNDSAENLHTMIYSNSKLLLYIGNLEHYQGVDMVIQAMADVADDVTFIIIGGIAEDIARCRELSESLNVANKVIFLGPRPVNLLQEYLTQADCLISPRTKGVNTPMKIYSYLGAGVPVIATDIASHTQVLNENNACLVEVSPASIAAAINKVVNDPVYARRLADHAKHDSIEFYSYQAYKTHLTDIYNKLQNRKHE